MSDYDRKGKVCVELKYELLEDFDSTMIELSHPDFDGSIYLTMPNIAKASQKISEIEHVSFFSRGFLDDAVEEDPDPDPGPEIKVVSKPSQPKEIVQVSVDDDTREMGREIVRENRNILDSFVGTLAGLVNTTREVRALIKDVKDSKQ